MRDQGLRARAISLALPALTGGFALALLVTATAGADTVAVADRPEGYLPAHVDLTGAQYANDLDGFSARLTVRDLQRRTSTLGFTLRFPKAGPVFRVSTTRTKAGKQTYAVVRERANGKTRRTCSSFVATWDDTRDVIDVHVPWSCLGDLRAPMRVQGHLSAGRSAGPRSTAHPDDMLRTVRVAHR